MRTALFALALACAAVPAAAQQTERDDRRIDRMERQVRAIEGIVRQGAATGRPVVVAPETLPLEIDALRTRLDDLEATLRSQNSTVEALTAELASARREATAANSQVGELQTRLAAVEARPVASPPVVEAVAGEAAPTTPLPAEEAATDASTAFQRARQRLLDGDYAGAGAAFEAYAARYPDDARTAEARYWLGETLYIREDYGPAAQAYVAALRGWPKATWAPDALVKLSGALVEVNEGPRACQTLGEFDRRYATSSASVKARAATIRTRAKCA